MYMVFLTPGGHTIYIGRCVDGFSTWVNMPHKKNSSEHTCHWRFKLNVRATQTGFLEPTSNSPPTPKANSLAICGICNLWTHIITLWPRKQKQGPPRRTIPIRSTHIIPSKVNVIWMVPSRDVHLALILWYLAKTIPTLQELSIN